MGLKIIIDRQLLSYLSSIPDDGSTYYLNHCDGFTILILTKLSYINLSLVLLPSYSHIKFNRFSDLKIAYLIVSSNIVPTTGHRNIVSLFPILVVYSLSLVHP